jgi:hypothetical protein
MKKILLLLLPLFLLADTKFVSSASFDENTKKFAESAAVIIEKEFDITLVKNFESYIYVDEAALYALKNRIVKFAIVRKNLFSELGLEFAAAKDYGFEPIFVNDEIVLLSDSRFVDSFPKAKKVDLIKKLDGIGKKLKD